MAEVITKGSDDMSRASFTVAYDGPGLADHTIDVRDLAPVLLALGDVVEAANSALNGGRASVSIRVHASGDGCYSISFEVLQPIVEKVIDFLNGRDITAANNLLALIGFASTATVAAATSLLRLLKWLRGKPAKVVEEHADGSRTVERDGEVMVIPYAVFVIYRSPLVRSAVERAIVDPLNVDGVEEFRTVDAENAVVVTKSEAGYYRADPNSEVTVNRIESRMVFTLADVSFRTDGKWRLHDGSATQPVAMEDAEFLRRIDAHEVAFAKDDVLVCDVQVVQKLVNDRLRTETTIVRVIDHKHAGQQGSLALD